jgi:membrane protein YqaA with SNARE-associated domain
LTAYFILFFSAFGAATIIPFSSEITVSALLYQGYPPAVVWLVASIGNSLGALLNWWLGRYLIRFKHSRWFPCSEATLIRAQGWFQRYGSWTLLLAWFPVIGDGLTVVAGIMRVRLLVFALLVTVGKALRYAVVIGLYYGLF